ncbi:antibiotic biosynthesis monooxygenase [soil metagenome]
MVKKGLFVRLEAIAGKEAEVEEFLNGGLGLVNEEPETIVWFALKFDDSTFGIFDAFEEELGRDAHLNGKVAAALMAKAVELFSSPPKIEMVDVIAAKLSDES